MTIKKLASCSNSHSKFGSFNGIWNSISSRWEMKHWNTVIFIPISTISDNTMKKVVINSMFVPHLRVNSFRDFGRQGQSVTEKWEVLAVLFICNKYLPSIISPGCNNSSYMTHPSFSPIINQYITFILHAKRHDRFNRLYIIHTQPGSILRPETS